MRCPLCQKDGAELFYQDKFRDFFLCKGCTIIFVPRSSILSPSEEKERYDSHQNDENDPGYRDYFLKTALPVIAELHEKKPGLDFGCGRTRLLSQIFDEKGFSMDSYDPFYFPDESIWQKKYGFAVMNEVIEHLTDPSATLQRLRTIVDGPLFVRTKLYPSTEKEFASWFYKRDATHVQFFSLRSLSLIGKVKEIGVDLYRIDWK